MKYIIQYSLFVLLLLAQINTMASSHREAPLISNDPLADNTDLYAFRSPDDPSTVTIIANYIPGQLPHGGPNYYTFGENIRYEIHIDNDVTTTGDDIVYRATFNQTNEDPSTFFNIRLGAENLKTTYTLERSMDGGMTFETIVTDGIVPPNNIGPRSIQSGVGLGAYSHETLIQNSIATASTGETVYCGPAEDPFFVDLAGVFDLGDMPRADGSIGRDGLECYNVHSIAIKVPISTLQKEGKDVSEAADILDGDFVIGVWASASRPAIRTLDASTGTESYSGDWVQVSRLGMPLTNEAVVPIGSKDEWNALTPYNENPAHYEYFFNPELGLYMDDDAFGGAVPSFSPLRIQTASLAGLVGPTFPGFDFTNGADGLYILKGDPLVAGTALDDAVFGTLLLPDAGKPRSVDLWPAFHTGVPNFPPYQLAVAAKGGNPLNAGKPFVNNFLPNAGDMLRLNMAVPPTPRDSDDFSALGLISAAVTGLTVPAFAGNTAIEFIPNMDGFPNGRRLEDDVTRIELQAVAGAVLAAVGLWYDDYDVTDPTASPVTSDLLNVISYSTGVDENDQPFRCNFPYVAAPYSGTGNCSGREAEALEDNACEEFTLWVELICSPDNNNYNLLVNVSGGTAPYTLDVGGAGTVTLTDEMLPFTLGAYTTGTGYDLTITDVTGCSTNESQTTVDCTTTDVELIEFYGTVKNNGNLISWVTASEVDSKYFTLQRSVDGQNFRDIKIIQSIGQSNTRQSYEFLDNYTQSGQVYYRLIEVNIEEQKKVYGIVSLNREKVGSFGISNVYPQPVLDILNFEYIATETETVSIQIYDAMGKLLISKDHNPSPGNNQVSVDLSMISTGYYLLQLRQSNDIVSTQLVKY